MRGLWEGDGGRVAGRTSYGTAWEGQGIKVVMDSRIQGMMGVTDHLSDRVPYQGGDEGMPSGGLPGKGQDADGNEGTFLAQTCTGRRDHLGVGKPPSSKVPTM